METRALASVEKSARRRNPLPQTPQQSLELALGETVIPKEAGSERGSGGIRPCRGGGKGPGMKSLPREWGLCAI